ncbi:MAG TPA: hypothetical protein VMR19_01480 [Candidatus Saccharimonadales bacterium]|nr:hypothetical protein [Candidatus Saccharimonadales bacterium]
MSLGRTEESPCAHCPIREMAIRGCCVQGQVPDELLDSQKMIVNRQKGTKMQVCEWLDPAGEGNRCTNPTPPEDCLAYTCGR